ncbi:hypothetical protein FB45DRAFT_888201 [Roridomyces roridus]|uniref:Sm domain-containing protein n=1 Tax=Roridomyces roridus TaxID=1738132 RepID=A0AAD7FZ01_9AGAR|nr:hypothetical protein FB45DRAFT_888201 [Roridomyces roridus]
MTSMSSAVDHLKHLLCETLRITVKDGRIFIGSFAGTDQPLNILLLNTDEFRVGPNENPDGRYVGQVLVPWKLVVKIDVQSSGGERRALDNYF